MNQFSMLGRLERLISARSLHVTCLNRSFANAREFQER